MPLTHEQRTPRAVVVILDRATLAMLALHAKQDPAQYAAGLLIRTCKTAAALGCTPADVPTAAAASIMTAAYSKP